MFVSFGDMIKGAINSPDLKTPFSKDRDAGTPIKIYLKGRAAVQSGSTLGH